MRALLTQERAGASDGKPLLHIAAVGDHRRHGERQKGRQRGLLAADQQRPGLTFDVTAIRAAAMDALNQLIDWNQQDEALLRTLNPVWEEAFNTGAKSIEQNFGITAVRTPA